MGMFHIGRKVPKGFEELPGSIHLGKGIWMLRMRPKVGVVDESQEATQAGAGKPQTIREEPNGTESEG